MGAEALNTYTLEKTLSERVIEIITETGMTKAELAIKTNYSRSAVSQYLRGKYNSDPADIEEALTDFVNEYEAKTQADNPDTKKNAVPFLKPKIQYFESRDFLQTIGVCRSCQEDMALGIIVAKSGYGKTHTLKKYAKMPRVAYIECDDTMACRDLVEAIENQIGMPKGAGGTIWCRVNRIRDFFNANEGYLLIIDEADKLMNKYTLKKMEIIRGIFDQSDVGVVIAGEPKLEAEIKTNLVRFANRMDFYYKLKGLSTQEVKDYLEGYDIDEPAMAEFISRAQNTQTGCFRLLDRTLNNVLRILRDSGKTKVTMKVISQASGMMMP